jgi:hypothetical protein
MICASVYLLVFIQNLFIHLAEKILLMQPLTFGGDYPDDMGKSVARASKQAATSAAGLALVTTGPVAVARNWSGSATPASGAGAQAASPAAMVMAGMIWRSRDTVWVLEVGRVEA